MDEADIRVRDYLMKHGKETPEKVTIRDVVRATGVSQGGVAKTSAWKVFQKAREQASCTERRAVRLSNAILRTRPDDRADSPVKQAIQKEEDEEIWKKILQMAESSDERAKLANLPEDRRQELIDSRRQQDEVAEPDNRSRGGRERLQCS
jgi:hypothetical protein